MHECTEFSTSENSVCVTGREIVFYMTSHVEARGPRPPVSAPLLWRSRGLGGARPVPPLLRLPGPGAPRPKSRARSYGRRTRVRKW